MTDTTPRVIPQPRIDTIGKDAASLVERRQTEYSGTIWVGDPPNVGGSVVITRGGAVRLQAAVFIPDSLPYVASRAAEVVVAATIAVQSEGNDPSRITDYRALLAPDPRGGDAAWLQLQLLGMTAVGIAISYRVVVLAPVGAVAG